MNPVLFANNFLGLAIIASHLAIIGVIVLLLARRSHPMIGKIQKNAIWLAFFVALGGTLTSLFYSEIALFTPCTLCWYQRIFLYPIVLALGISLYKRNNEGVDFSLLSSGIGGIIALYHWIYQINPSQFAPCSTSLFSVSCAEKYVQIFGYITIPLMSLTGFALVIGLLLIRKLRLNP